MISTCLLFLRDCGICREVFVEVGYNIALDADIFHIERCARGGNGVHACGVVNEIGRKGRILNLAILQVAGKLMHQRAHHLKMPKFLYAY